MTTESSRHEASPISGSEFEAALGRAESFLQQADEGRKRIGRYRAGLVAAWHASAIVVTTALATAEVGVLAGVVAVIVAVLANAVLSYQIQAVVTATLKSAVRRDERCAAETVGLLREVLPFVARDEEWTVFRIEEARLRIGRFPIRGGRP